MLYEKHESVAFGFDENASELAAADAVEEGCEVAVIEDVDVPVMSPGGWVTDAGCDVGVVFVEVHSWREKEDVG